MKKILQYLPFILITCVTVLLFIKVNQNGKDAADKLLGSSHMVGKQVADHQVDVIFPAGNDKMTAENYKGGYTVINLFASWCLSCLYEHKFIKGLKGTKDLKIIGIAWRDKKEDALQWLDTNGNPYDKVGLDSQGKFGILMGVTGIPETFLLDKNGTIIMHINRTVTQADIEEIKKKIVNNL